ncbi:hypothetical protein [Rhizobium sp. P28RR-XV]|uniref:hypothetical protein n=1 Tax=Rhizobium sp. P28RR-XV TaxID=2726737 RepID=UPI00145708B3|nr:hypothetical protein [Rhizobium sp. P28RR-XV]
MSVARIRYDFHPQHAVSGVGHPSTADATGTAAPQRAQSGTDSLIAVATGQANMVSVSRQPTPAQSKVSEAMFSMSGNSIAKQKLDLIERTGKALGIERSSYASMDDFVAAMKKAFGEIKVQPGGMGAIHGLEKELGLDKLGLSLEDVINSATDGGDNDKVTRAFEKRSHKDKDKKDDTETDDGSKTTQEVVVDQVAAGLYGLLSFS